MPFRFSLAAVLKYREALEQMQFLALEKVQHEIATVKAQHQFAERSRAAMAEERAAELARGMRAFQLQGAFERELEAERYRDQLAKKLCELAIKRQECLKAYEEVRQKRDLLEKLRARKLGEYTREQTKAEQAVIDDLFLSRRKPSQ
jgi:flagellar FliJ protein